MDNRVAGCQPPAGVSPLPPLISPSQAHQHLLLRTRGILQKMGRSRIFIIPVWPQCRKHLGTTPPPHVL